jgi:hypothetical protein
MYIVRSKVKQRGLANELSNIIRNVVLVSYLTFCELINAKLICIVPQEGFFTEILHLASIRCSFFEHLLWNIKDNYD